MNKSERSKWYYCTADEKEIQFMFFGTLLEVLLDGEEEVFGIVEYKMLNPGLVLIGIYAEDRRFQYTASLSVTEENPLDFS